ncbi:MAG: formate dehydrogenase subunit gamma [Paracoccaceae bacterium]
MSRIALVRGLSAVPLALVLAFAVLIAPSAGEAQSVRPPAEATNNEYPVQAPGQQAPRDFSREMPEELRPDAQAGGLQTQGANSSTSLWREVRSGEAHTVSIPNAQAGILVQSAGAGWISWRDANGPLVVYGLWAFAGILLLLALFYFLRGRIKVEHGLSGVYLVRFNALERFGHWLLAGSFILLALTGLNLLMGKAYLMPLIGKAAFAEVSIAGKWVHNNVAWAFMAALVLTFALWVRNNIPERLDLQWIAKGGGLFVKGVHPPSRKFNAGQKMIFWSTIVLGASVSASGLSLLFPYALPMFEKTFALLDSTGVPAMLGVTLPTTLSAIEEMQYAQIWHTIVSLVMMVIIVAHIYIGSVGMQGAFAAMGSGRVDRNWAIEHHGLWVEEEDAKARQGGRGAAPGSMAGTPAE